MAAHHRPAPARAGIGLRLPHLAEVVATRRVASWFEIHPENFLANPHARELLIDLARSYPISVHSVGISVGSVGGIDRAHLKRVRDLVDAIYPVLVSGHLAWSTHEGEYLNDLLPLPYNRETLRIVGEHLDHVQQGLGRPFLLENPSNYVGIATSTMNEVEFLSELVERTGCRLLCDVSNVYLSSHNLDYDPQAYLDAMPGEAIDELHLGGFVPEDEGIDSGKQVLVDTHDRRIAQAAWDLYAYALRRFGPKPTLIEWDNDLPAIATLLSEADAADAIAAATLEPERRRAVG